MKLKALLRNSILLLLFVFAYSVALEAQEVNAKVTIDHSQIQGTNVSVFNTLEKSLMEFVNNQKWTNEEYMPNERVDCNFFISISSNEGSSFKGTMTVSARRPIYNASISTTLLNMVDNELSFTYNEFDQLIFNRNSLTQDLTAVLGFYIYTILGIDADTFKEFGGDAHYTTAMGIVNSAQSSTVLNEGGWDRLGSKRNRHVLISELLSAEFRPYRTYLYQYHRKGLDVMADATEEGLGVIFGGLSLLEKVFNDSPASYTMLLFFDAKTDEFQNMIKNIPNEDAERKKTAVDILKRIDPSRMQLYARLMS